MQQIPSDGWVVAVNFWYNMDFDTNFAYHKFIEDMAVRTGLLQLVDSEERTEQEHSRDSSKK